MEKKNFLASLMGCIVLCGFAAMSLASTSSKEASDFRDGFRAGYEYMTSDTQVDPLDMDSITVNSDNDVAMIDE